jgi:ferredoxin
MIACAVDTTQDGVHALGRAFVHSTTVLQQQLVLLRVAVLKAALGVHDTRAGECSRSSSSQQDSMPRAAMMLLWHCKGVRCAVCRRCAAACHTAGVLPVYACIPDDGPSARARQRGDEMHSRIVTCLQVAGVQVVYSCTPRQVCVHVKHCKGIGRHVLMLGTGVVPYKALAGVWQHVMNSFQRGSLHVTVRLGAPCSSTA